MYASSCQLLTSIVFICFSSGEDFQNGFDEIFWNRLHFGSCHFSIEKSVLYPHDIRLWYLPAIIMSLISQNFAISNGCSLIWHPRAIAFDSCLHRYISCPLFANALFLWWTWLAYICRGTSFSRFGAFAADSDYPHYPYYPHHPEPHFLLSPNSFSKQCTKPNRFSSKNTYKTNSSDI